MARVFPFIVKAKHKTLHVIWAWAKLEILQKKHSARDSIDRALQKLNSNFLQLLDSNFTHKLL